MMRTAKRLGAVSGFSALLVAALSAGTTMLVGCGADEPIRDSSTAGALTRFVPEEPGANCAAGGQALLVGVDRNGDDVLAADEVTATSYVCNGAPPPKAPVMTPIPVGDPRCPAGGTLLQIEQVDANGKATTKDIVICNGASGEQGKEGEQGERGEKGERGDAGPAGESAPSVTFGQFVPSQVAMGLVITCATTSTTTTVATCQGMKVNGLDVRLHPTDANAICNAVIGKGYASASGVGAINGAYLTWNGTSWVLANGSTSPMQTLSCNR